ncbi:hypothetical protein Aph01nite_34380 [Acrocarpospora phusangensis]|uniref:Uncharacterized protein n=1 Tax=Acrocarpospora phusangensis TaxID=1070424 RepID=A0A919UP93_9ACTN|nr:hypothetical protein [Acrocarpospora phusangensis]GIH25128.1 hypothetical protein Aph01nite_34380 [Acrocarpospora phusangensis]
MNDMSPPCPAWCAPGSNTAAAIGHGSQDGRRVHWRDLGQATRRLDVSAEAGLIQVEYAAVEGEPFQSDASEKPANVRVYWRGPTREERGHGDFTAEQAAVLAWLLERLTLRELRTLGERLNQGAALLAGEAR